MNDYLGCFSIQRTRRCKFLLSGETAAVRDLLAAVAGQDEQAIKG